MFDSPGLPFELAPHNSPSGHVLSCNVKDDHADAAPDTLHYEDTKHTFCDQGKSLFGIEYLQ